MSRTPFPQPPLQDQEVEKLTQELLARVREVYGEKAPDDLVEEMLRSCLGLLEDRAQRGDIKLLNFALKEMRKAFRVFAPFGNIRKVAVFGSARTRPSEPTWKQAREFSEKIVARGWMVITGAGDGIMGAAQGGAGRERSFGVNIRLPFEQTANRVIAGDHKLVNFRYFFTRKVTFVKESHAIALFPGGFGTHDEGFESLTLIQTGKSEILPLVFIDEPGGSYWREWHEYVVTHLGTRGLISPDDTALYRVTDSVEEALREILNFYSNYHSSRYVRGRLVMRVWSAPTGAQLEQLNEDFGDILKGGRIEARSALPEENGDFPQLPRIVLQFNRRDTGRLRLLIDRLNGFVAQESSSPRQAGAHQILPEEVPEGTDELAP